MYVFVSADISHHTFAVLPPRSRISFSLSLTYPSQPVDGSSPGPVMMLVAVWALQRVVPHHANTSAYFCVVKLRTGMFLSC